MYRPASFFMLVWFAATMCDASADIYRWKDSKGQVVFSDRPEPGAIKVEITTTTVVAAPHPPQPDGTQDSTKAPIAYESLEIANPANDSTIRDNGIATVAVSVAVQPALQSAHQHKLQLLFDGSPVGEPGNKSSFNLAAVNRGAHTLQAVIADAGGKVLKRSPVSNFFVHKVSIQNRAQP